VDRSARSNRPPAQAGARLKQGLNWRCGWTGVHCSRLQYTTARKMVKGRLGRHWRVQMKKLKHEAELFKAALLAGVQYAEGRKAVEFEANDSASDKALYVYRLLVHDKVISPMPENQVGEKTIRHRLATWYAHQLPQGHPLLE
jgi:hypothetical protein